MISKDNIIENFKEKNANIETIICHFDLVIEKAAYYKKVKKKERQPEKGFYNKIKAQ